MQLGLYNVVIMQSVGKSLVSLEYCSNFQNQITLNVQGDHFSGIWVNLEMSRNSAQVSEKSGKKAQSQRKVGKCV